MKEQEYIHLFKTESTYARDRKEKYSEPWVSYTLDVEKVNYNKSWYESASDIPLTFDILSDGLVYWKTTNAEFSKTIQYKINDGEWTDITATTGGTSFSVQSGDTVQFKGENAAYSSASTNTYCGFSGTTASFNAKGNIMSLVHGLNYLESDSMAEGRTFSCFFRDCITLVDMYSLLLPTKTLTNFCYAYMFRGCTAMTTPMKSIPATTMASGSCYGMFQNNTSMENSPELPAKTLAGGCYTIMFRNCGSLSATPKLPADILPVNSYREMFGNCSGLTGCSEILATEFGETSCYMMFYGCTNLVTGPSRLGVSSSEIGNSACTSMFHNCYSLVSTPELPAMNLSPDCYIGMFHNCSGLTHVSELPATVLPEECYDGMFTNCTSLVSGPSVINAESMDRACCYCMFSGCTSLTSAPALPSTNLGIYCYRAMFSGCTSLTTAPELPATTLARYCYEDMFHGCSNLHYIKALFTTTPGTSYTENWVDGVASSGIFVKNAAASWTTTGVNGIPTGWTVQNA